MLRFLLKEPDGKERAVFFEKDVVRIGKSGTNDLILPEPAVSRRHAIVRRTGDRVYVEDLVSTNGTFVNGKRISGPQKIVLRDRIYIANYILQLDMITSDEEPTMSTEFKEVKTTEQRPDMEERKAPESWLEEDSQDLFEPGMKTLALSEQEMEGWIQPAKKEEKVQPLEESALEERADKASTEEIEALFEEEEPPPSFEVFEEEKAEKEIPIISLGEEDVRELYGPESPQIERDIAEEESEVPALGAWMEEEEEMPSPGRAEPVEAPSFEEEESLEVHEEISPEPPVSEQVIWPAKIAPPLEADSADIADIIYKLLLDHPELCRRFLEPGQDADSRRTAFQDTVRELMDEGDMAIPAHIAWEELIKQMMEESLEPGIVEKLMSDPENRSILINGKERVFVERSGKIERTEHHFTCPGAVTAVVYWMLAKMGKKVDSSNPIVDGRLENGAEIHAIFPPLAVSGPCVTIRRPGGVQFTMDALIENKSLSREMAQLLKMGVENGMNILISGVRGSGKITLLGALASLIPEEERIVTIEEWPELKLSQENVVSLLAKAPDAGGRDMITMVDLAQSSLQMRADKLILNECSCEDAAEILHSARGLTRGVLATVSAHSPRQVINQLAASSGLNKSPWAILPWIGSLVDLIVQCTLMSDGTRRVMRICELADSPDDLPVLRDVFKFEPGAIDKETGLLGTFVPQNIVPRCVEEIEMRGVSVDRQIFQIPQEY